MGHLQNQEATEYSCRALIYYLSKLDPEVSPAEREMLLRDLCWRAGHMEPLERAIVLTEAFYGFLPNEIRKSFPEASLKFSEFEQLRYKKRKRLDVGIVTVIGKELAALLTALGKHPDDRADVQIEGFSYWFAEISRQIGPPLKVVITMVGEARNVPCAIAVDRLLSDFEIDIIALTGIAAGPRSKTDLGDVVYAEQVYDYEEYRLELVKWFGIPTWIRKALARPKHIPTQKVIKIALERMNLQPFEKLFKESLTRTSTDMLPKDYMKKYIIGREKPKMPKIHDGTIVAGEKLIADGSLEKMRIMIDERIRAADMEDSGFSQAADIKGIPWCVFRGISDHADPHKENGWQFVAALAAACAALTFFKTSWDLPTALRPLVDEFQQGLNRG